MVRTYQKTKQKITLYNGRTTRSPHPPHTVAKALNPSLIALEARCNTL